MKKTTYIFLAVLFVFFGLQAQDVRKLNIDGDIINLEAGETYKITPNTAGASYEILKGSTSQGVFPYSKTINTFVGLKLNQAILTLGFEEPFTLTSTIVPVQAVTYASSDESIATVNSSTGLVTGKTAGTATITATAGEQTATCEVTVKTLAQRIADAAGTTATIVVYADEAFSTAIAVNTNNSIITLTTPDDTERILKKTAIGNLLSVGANNSVIIEGHVTLKGLATLDYGGTDDLNNTNSLVNVILGGTLTLKGNAKVTGNAYVVENPSETNLLGGGITSRGLLVVDENAQISNNTVCCAKPYPTPWSATSRNGKATWGGGVYLTGSTSVMEIRGNAKITGNRAINKGGNSFSGAIFPEAGSTVKMYGGEISGNSAEASHRAAGGAFHLTTAGKIIMSGGVIKDNILIYGGAGTGVACLLEGDRLYLSGSASIPAKSGTRDTELTGYTTITGIPMYQDDGNTVHLYLNSPCVRVAGTLTGTAPVATFDITAGASPRVLGKYDPETFALSNFTTDAPVDQFALGSYLTITGTFATLQLNPINDKVIKSDGTIGTPE